VCADLSHKAVRKSVSAEIMEELAMQEGMQEGWPAAVRTTLAA
jgi:hypothetical protein